MLAYYGYTVAWDSRHAADIPERVAKLAQAKAAGPELYSQWLSHYGLVNEEHYIWIRDYKAGFNRAEVQQQADKKLEEGKQQHAGRADAMRATGELAPVMGVALELWAQAQAQIASGAALASILPAMGIDEATWHAVSAEWNARMSRDTTATIATVYSQAFTGAGAGQFAASGQATAAAMNPGGSTKGTEAPVSMEKWIEITVAQEAGHQQGRDPAEVLGQFGISPADWGTIGGWWGHHFNAHAMEMMEDYNRLTAKYEAQYGIRHDADDSDDGTAEIVAHLIALATCGRDSEITSFLQGKFPKDADDLSALDWWVEQACDKCGETGERRAAEQLLAVRYRLQEDEEDPMHEWIASEMDMIF